MSDQGEEPFPFEEMPLNCKQKVLEKFIYKDFATFSLCSRECDQLSSSKLFRVPMAVYRVYVTPGNTFVKITKGKKDIVKWESLSKPPVRIVSRSFDFNCDLTERKCERFFRLVNDNKAEGKILNLKGNVSCQSSSLSRIIQSLGISQVTAYNYIGEEFFNEPVFQKLESLKLCECGITDEQLVENHSKNIEFISDFITDWGINKILLQWVKGERKTESAMIEGPNQSEIDTKTIFEGTGAKKDEHCGSMWRISSKFCNLTVHCGINRLEVHQTTEATASSSHQNGSS